MRPHELRYREFRADVVGCLEQPALALSRPLCRKPGAKLRLMASFLDGVDLATIRLDSHGPRGALTAAHLAGRWGDLKAGVARLVELQYRDKDAARDEARRLWRLVRCALAAGDGETWHT